MEKKDGTPAIILVMSLAVLGLAWFGGNIQIELAEKYSILSYLFGPVYCYLAYWVLRLIYLLISGEV